MLQVYFGSIIVTGPPMAKGDESPQIARLSVVWANDMRGAILQMHEAAKAEFPDAESVSAVADTVDNLLSLAEKVSHVE